jgi:hypothetical protein
VWSESAGRFFLLPETWINSVNSRRFVGYSTATRLSTCSVRNRASLWIDAETDVSLIMDGIYGDVPPLNQTRAESLAITASPHPGNSRWVRHISASGLICGYDSRKYQGVDANCRAFAGEPDSLTELETPQGRSGSKAHCIDDAGLVVGYSLDTDRPSTWRPTAWILHGSSSTMVHEGLEPGFFHHCSGGEFAVGSVFRNGVHIGGVFDFKRNSWRLVYDLVDVLESSHQNIKLWGCNSSGWAVGFCYSTSSAEQSEGRAVIVPPGSETAYVMDAILAGMQVILRGQNAGSIGIDVSLTYCESISESNTIAVSGYSHRIGADFLLILECIEHSLT